MTRNKDQVLDTDLLDDDEEQALIDQVCAEWGVKGIEALWNRFDGEPQPFMGPLAHDKGLASVLAEGAVYSLGGGYFQPMDKEALIQAANETICQNLARVSESPTHTIWLIRASTGCKGKVTFGPKPSLYERGVNGEATFGAKPSLHERSVNGEATFGTKPSLHERGLEEKRDRLEEKVRKNEKRLRKLEKPSLHERDLGEKRGRLEEKIRKNEERLRKVEKKLRKEERAGHGEGAMLAQVHNYEAGDQDECFSQASDQASSSDQDEAAWRKKARTKAQSGDDEDEDEVEASSYSKTIVRKKGHEIKSNAPADKDQDEDEGVVSAHKKKSHQGRRTLEQTPPVTDQDIEDLLNFKVAD
ncbi:unnamed protein product [Cercospora beticola]|nr:unnamed protein product [Cercospora beticola]